MFIYKNGRMERLCGVYNYNNGGFHSLNSIATQQDIQEMPIVNTIHRVSSSRYIYMVDRTRSGGRTKGKTYTITNSTLIDYMNDNKLVAMQIHDLPMKDGSTTPLIYFIHQRYDDDYRNYIIRVMDTSGNIISNFYDMGTLETDYTQWQKPEMKIVKHRGKHYLFLGRHGLSVWRFMDNGRSIVSKAVSGRFERSGKRYFSASYYNNAVYILRKLESGSGMQEDYELSEYNLKDDDIEVSRKLKFSMNSNGDSNPRSIMCEVFHHELVITNRANSVAPPMPWTSHQLVYINLDKMEVVKKNNIDYNNSIDGHLGTLMKAGTIYSSGDTSIHLLAVSYGKTLVVRVVGLQGGRVRYHNVWRFAGEKFVALNKSVLTTVNDDDRVSRYVYTFTGDVENDLVNIKFSAYAVRDSIHNLQNADYSLTNDDPLLYEWR